MRTRADLLTEIVEHVVPADGVLDDLHAYGWDSEIELVTVTREHVLNALAQLEAGLSTASEVTDWANTIEGRDDLRYQDVEMHEVIRMLANPEINFPLDQGFRRRVEKLFG